MYHSSYLVMVEAKFKKKKCRRRIFLDSCPEFIHSVLKKKTTFPLEIFSFFKKKEQRMSSSSHLG